MKKIINMRFIIICLLVLLSFNLVAQNFMIGTQTGFGHYKMTELNWLNEGVDRRIPFNTKTFASYPSYFYYQPVIKVAFNNVSIGILYSFQSTGTRIAAKDYSGEYKFDTKIKSNAGGFICDVQIIQNERKNLGCSFYSEAGVIKSTLETTEYLLIFDEEVTDLNRFYYSFNYFIEPGISVNYKYSYFVIEANLGYFIQFAGDCLEDKEKKIINNQSGQGIKPEWNGLRYGFSVFFEFPFVLK